MSSVSRHTRQHAPVGLWQFDGDLTDSSGNGFNLTVEAGAVLYGEISPGVRAVYLDGSTQLIYNTYTALLNILGDLTIECLISMIAYPASGVSRFIATHAASGETYSTNFSYEFGISGPGTPTVTRFLSESGAGVNALYTITALPALGAINHLAVTRASNVIQFYLNGKPWGSASGSQTQPTGGESGRFRVGDANSSSYAPNCFLSSLKVISRALTAAEIKAEYGRTIGTVYSSYSPPSNLDIVCEDTIAINDAVFIPVQYHDTTHSPVGLWQFNGNLNDASGNSFTMTVEAGTERYSEIVPGITGAYLDGSTRLFRNANEATLAITGDITIEMLLLLPSVAAQASIVNHGDSGGTSTSNFLYSILTNSTYSLSFFSESGTKSGATLQRPLASISYNAPCHFAVTRTSNVIQFYLNGAAIGTSGSQTAPTGGSIGKLRVSSSGNPLTGCIASLKIISSALTSGQVAAEYSRTLGRLYDSVVAL